MKQLLLYLLPLCIPFALFAQQATSDSLPRTDSAQITQDVIIQQQQQKLDSLVRVQLQQQLKNTVADSKEFTSLTEKLQQLEATDSARKANQIAKIAVLKKSAVGYPVVPFEDTLFTLFTSVGSVSAGERAALIAEKIRNLYKANFYTPDSLQMVVSDNEADIRYNNVNILAVTDFDALWGNSSKEKIAAVYLSRINAAVTKERNTYSLLNWAKRIALVLLTIGVLLLIIYVINRLFKKGVYWISRRRKVYFTGIRIKNAQLMHPAQQYSLVVNLFKVLRIIIILLTLYLSLPVLFSVFPETKSYTQTLLEWIIVPVKGILHSLAAFLPNLFTIIVVFYFTKFLIKAVRYFSQQVEDGNIELSGFHKEFAKPTFNIIRFLLYAFMMVIIWPYLPGHDSPAFQGISVFLGVLLSFGSSSAISNLIAGLIITYMRPFQIGDRVKIGDVTGDVLEKTMLVTRVRTPKNEDVTIPNSTVLSNYTVNYSSNALNTGLIVHLTITLGYDAPWKKVYEVMIKAALQTDLILHNPKPFVLQTSLGDFSVAYQLNAYTHEANKQAKIYSDLMQNLQDCCNEAGIEIMSPIYNVVRRNEETTIPEEYRKGEK